MLRPKLTSNRKGTKQELAAGEGTRPSLHSAVCVLHFALKRASLPRLLRFYLPAFLLIAVTGCKHAAPPPPPPAPTKVLYSENYDKEIREIMELAGKDQWEEAETKAAALQQKDPKNPMLERVHSWVMQAGQKRREQALENKIRDIDSKNSV